MSREHYPLWLRLDGLDRYAIWYSDNSSDRVMIGHDGLIVSFVTITHLREYALEQDFVLADTEPILHDLDALTSWLNHPRKDNMDCDIFLMAWNLFGDVAASVQEDFDIDQARTQKIYLKLFWGNNLPAVTPPSKHYTPIWTKSEVGLMHRTLSQGLCLVREHLAKADNSKFAKTNPLKKSYVAA